MTDTPQCEACRIRGEMCEDCWNDYLKSIYKSKVTPKGIEE